MDQLLKYFSSLPSSQQQEIYVALSVYMSKSENDKQDINEGINDGIIKGGSSRFDLLGLGGSGARCGECGRPN